MSLSAFAQYYLRKLMHKHLDSFGGLLPAGCQHNLPMVDVNQLLNQFYTQTHPSAAPHREMEIWVQMHQDLDHSTSENRQHAEEVERRILGLLGFRLGQIARYRQPVIQMEQACIGFRFHHNGHICEGLRHGTEIYGLVHQLQKNPRFQVYQLTCALLEREIPCLMTTSAKRCAVWVPLRSPVYSILAQTSSTLLRCLIMLHVHRHKLHGGSEQQGPATVARDGVSSGSTAPVPTASPSASHPGSIALETIAPARSRKLFEQVARRQLG